MKNSLKIFLILFIFLASGANLSDEFQIVIENAKEEIVRNKLISFREGGIEKRVEISSYDADQIIEYAKSFIGTPHKMGGCSRSGIDCSGLVMMVHSNFGIQLPRICHEQARFGKVIAQQDDLKKGDLVFFYNSYNSANLITHSGIYIGNGQFIHTSNSKGVKISKVNDPYYWGERYLFGTRIKDSSD